jgi:hypothetical protein
VVPGRNDVKLAVQVIKKRDANTLAWDFGQGNKSDEVSSVSALRLLSEVVLKSCCFGHESR